MHLSFARCFFFYLSFLFPPVEPGVFNCCETIKARSDIFRPCFYIMYKIINIFINFSAILHIVLLTFGRCKFNIKLTEIF